jgi:phosphatidylglycerol:prolipoprotein diacylglycerol transferase
VDSTLFLNRLYLNNMDKLIFEHDLSESIISFGPVTIYWYSLMFLLAFFAGYKLMEKIYIKENKDLKLLDPFLVHMVLGTLIGARLGEVFFTTGNIFKIIY